MADINAQEDQKSEKDSPQNNENYLSSLSVGGSNQQNYLDKLVSQLSGRLPEDYNGSYINGPGFQSSVEQYRPQSNLEAPYTYTEGRFNLQPIDLLNLGILGSQYNSDQYQQQRVGANAGLNLPVGPITLSPNGEITASRVPGEYGTGGWVQDPAIMALRASGQIGDGNASLEARKIQGEKPSYQASYSQPLGNGIDWGALARMSPSDLEKSLQLLLYFNRRF